MNNFEIFYENIDEIKSEDLSTELREIFPLIYSTIVITKSKIDFCMNNIFNCDDTILFLENQIKPLEERIEFLERRNKLPNQIEFLKWVVDGLQDLLNDTKEYTKQKQEEIKNEEALEIKQQKEFLAKNKRQNKQQKELLAKNKARKEKEREEIKKQIEILENKEKEKQTEIKNIDEKLQDLSQTEQVRENLMYPIITLISYTIGSMNHYDIELVNYCQKLGMDMPTIMAIYYAQRREDVSYIFSKYLPTQYSSIVNVLRLKKMSASTKFRQNYRIASDEQVGILWEKRNIWK